MTNAEKFKQVFGLYATELWAMPEKDFLIWLNADVPDKNVGDMISRQAAIRLITGYNGTVDKSVAKRLLLQLPSAQPETAKRIVGKSKDGMTMWYQCDMCNEPVDRNDLYCRGCGRKFVNG